MLQTNHHILEPHYSCGICHEAVSNPICPRCIAEQVQAWLTQYPNYHELRDALLPKIKNFFKQHLREGTTTCIKCNEKSASICPYCFTDYILDELKRMNVHPTIIREFLEFFNFDLEHKGYYKEAEDEGII